MPTLLVTGSSGLIGSEVCAYFAKRGWRVHGVDNNQRAVFFGSAGDTRWNQRRLEISLQPRFTHHELDIRDRQGVRRLVAEVRPGAIVHAAAQPSHDRAAAIPFEDFDTNASGTLNLLEAARQACPESPFVHMSTNKVYGDRPNTIPLRETETRFEFDDPRFEQGIGEDFPIDQSLHSLFGASKAAADMMVQEYGRYFDMPTCCLRGGCLTGAHHAGVELHGFLSFLVKCNVQEQCYTVFGYGGKQVRDNIHALDVARFMDAFIQAPRRAAVYNLGGGKANTCSVLEAFGAAEKYSGKKMRYTYVEEHRMGDHKCYFSDLRKMQAHYPDWRVTITLDDIIRELVRSWRHRLNT
ncbi:MAG: CDP-paratose 2-epimerase [Candidatus Kentron sp. G]|nr:MAG: CDP-paratose 2-epimerase [Candidatus Kentron sp. G]VFN05615.1 MAG: CDP-paratose 2-epimerase [Candidatus Kentron sp. G]VFN06590.1 MAG: CDP-paratose 2-epimerase [Candidatus Kentron sp. G]